MLCHEGCGVPATCPTPEGVLTGHLWADPGFELVTSHPVDALGLGPGAYEYEFILDGQTDHPVADPFADEITPV
jgi:hypothetical protein